MDRFRKKVKNRLKRKASIKTTIRGSEEMPRVSIFRSNKHIYAQIIDDSNEKTLASSSDVSLKLKKGVNKTDKAMNVGEELGKKAISAKVKAVVFDRSGYKYHGRVKALAEGLRKAGLKF